ncbi:hypothetical protein BJX61DRAFT_541654 [Aspergillus egyptiacus]|nr:hypothetical protein BJX61DRAFT_541654 [Aspergillus egyptiacus]
MSLHISDYLSHQLASRTAQIPGFTVTLEGYLCEAFGTPFVAFKLRYMAFVEPETPKALKEFTRYTRAPLRELSVEAEADGDVEKTAAISRPPRVGEVAEGFYVDKSGLLLFGAGRVVHVEERDTWIHLVRN